MNIKPNLFLLLYQNYASETETFIILSAFALLFILAFIFKDSDNDNTSIKTEKKSANQFFKDLKNERNNRIIEAENKLAELKNNYQKTYPDATIKVWKDYDNSTDDFNINFNIEQDYKLTKDDMLNFANTSINENLFIGKNNDGTGNFSGVIVKLNECLSKEGKNYYINRNLSKIYIDLILDNYNKLGKEYEIVDEDYGKYFNQEQEYSWTLYPKKEIIHKASRRISQVVKDKVWKRDEGKCTQCGSREKLEFDHIIPHSKGGANTYRNIQLLCEKCNRTKSDKIG